MLRVRVKSTTRMRQLLAFANPGESVVHVDVGGFVVQLSGVDHVAITFGGVFLLAHLF